MKRAQPGDRLIITMWDHCLNSSSDSIHKVRVHGELHAATEDKVILDHWVTLEPDQKGDRDAGDNLETLAIVRGCIIDTERVTETEKVRI